ncbi:endonuclease [Vibrio phage 184E37-3b]|nr:hypothetical protein MYOV056v2_p0140 [Vibrio phage 184E37.3a]QZI90167.1 hypothetical protein MYOV057v1_p0252 [Vibrio phage 184E37.1]
MAIPESEWTKRQREFVGTTFDTPKGSVLTVTGVSGKSKTGVALFSLMCSICSLDEELWSFGSIKGNKNNIVKGGYPCGCAFNPKWTEEQYKIRIQKECKERGYVFHGWSGEFKGQKTKLDLENPTTGNRWKSTNISNLFSGANDPAEKDGRIGLANSVDTLQHIKDFMNTGAFLDGTEFTREGRGGSDSKKGYYYWVVECPKCSNDEYVKNGVCSGKFKTHKTTLKNGHNPCRCGERYCQKIRTL